MSENRQDQQEAAARKARADLLRLQQQSEKIMGAPATEKEALDEQDAAEVWGKRIAFCLSLLAGAYALWWFWDQIFN